MRPVAIDFCAAPVAPEHQIRRKSDQAIAPARFPAFNRFQQPITTPRLNEFERG